MLCGVVSGDVLWLGAVRAQYTVLCGVAGVGDGAHVRGGTLEGGTAIKAVFL